ncbi:MAG: ketoacyl-ACP synthase III [Hyphomicrobiaceae bacterium]
MIGIKAIGSYVPDGGFDTLSRAEEFGTNEAFLRDKTGFLFTPRKAKEEATSDLCVKAYNDLTARMDFDPAQIDCLIVCTQNPDVHGIPHTSAIVHKKLGLPDHCATFDISLGCSGYVYGLSIASAFMDRNGLRKGLFFTADPYSCVMDENDKNTALLFGDGAAVTLLDEAPVWQLDRFMFESKSEHGDAIRIKENGVLSMNGRAVFAFSATAVPPMIKRLLAAEEVSDEDVDLYLLHQGSKYIVDTICQRLETSPDKVPFGAARTGNTVSSTLPLLLKDIDDKSVRRIVLCGFGVGLSLAAGMLSRS